MAALPRTGDLSLSRRQSPLSANQFMHLRAQQRSPSTVSIQQRCGYGRRQTRPCAPNYMYLETWRTAAPVAPSYNARCIYAPDTLELTRTKLLPLVWCHAHPPPHTGACALKESGQGIQWTPPSNKIPARLHGGAIVRLSVRMSIHLPSLCTLVNLKISISVRTLIL